MYPKKEESFMKIELKLKSKNQDITNIKIFDKNVKFFIPDIVYNRLIERNLRKLGFKNFTKLIQTVTPLTQYSLMEKKLSLI